MPPPYDAMTNSEIVELKGSIANSEGFYTHWAGWLWKSESRTRMKFLWPVGTLVGDDKLSYVECCLNLDS